MPPDHLDFTDAAVLVFGLVVLALIVEVSVLRAAIGQARGENEKNDLFTDGRVDELCERLGWLEDVVRGPWGINHLTTEGDDDHLYY